VTLKRVNSYDTGRPRGCFVPIFGDCTIYYLTDMYPTHCG